MIQRLQKNKAEKSISHCQHCQALFIPEKHGAETILCKKCIFKAEEAHATIQSYLKKTTETESVESVAHATQYPKAWVQGLYLSGRLQLTKKSKTSSKSNGFHNSHNKKQIIQALKQSIKTPNPLLPSNRTH